MIRIILFAFLFQLSFCAVAIADVYRYVDDSGKTHYVDAEEKVPEKYRSQLIGAKPLPPISREKGFRVVPQAKKSSSKASAKRVEVFVTSWCPHCQQLESELTAKKVKYTRYDIEKSAEGEKKYLALGGGGIPVTKIGDVVIRGNNAQGILSALGR